MSTQEMIREIDKKLGQLPDNVVKEVYALVSEVSTAWSNKLLKQPDALEKLFDKYDDVFKKLAQ